MAAPSPTDGAGGLTTFAITANGAPLPDSFQVMSIEVWHELDRLPKVRLIIADGSPADQTFPISESSTLIPGVALTVALGYDYGVTTVFSGVIHRQGLEIAADGVSRLVVEATDRAMVMTLTRGNAVFQNMTDSAICQALIGAAGLTAKVESTAVTHEAIVQYDASAWDLLVMRAQASGMGVSVDGGVVTVAAPNTAAAPVLALTYGQSILDLRIEMDASTQIAASAVETVAWDPVSQTLAAGATPVSSIQTPGNLSSTTLAQVFAVAPVLQQTGGDLTIDELSAWGDAKLQRGQLSKIRGQIRFQGNALAKVGCMVSLDGLGARFDGAAYVSAVRHSLGEGLWTTTVEVGRDAAWFAATAPRIAAPGAAGLLPPVAGLQSGTVRQVDGDPQGDYRVLVQVPLLQSNDGIWARLGPFAAAGDAWPKVGDEVVLGFLNNDPRYPVILGSLYSRTNPPPGLPTG